MGRLADVQGPPELVQRAIDLFVRVFQVDLSEVDAPADGFPTFDAFFTRALRPGSRPVDPDPEVLVCPADGVIADAGSIEADAAFRVKGRLYDVAAMFGSDANPARFAGGSFVVIYLAPPDYHRVHAPTAGDVVHVRHVDGTLYPVNGIGEHVPGLLARNERVCVTQRSREHGEVVTVLVGAIGVGRISLAFDDLWTNEKGERGDRVRRFGVGDHGLERGAELGMFHMGSTVVIFTDRDHPVHFDLGPGDRTRVGARLGRVAGGDG
jgi:phosphatidylserine decarboxylase